MIFTCLTGKRLWVSLLVIFALILCETAIKAQNTVGIGTPSPNTNAVLDLVSPGGNQGLLVPRISTAQRQAMASSLGTNETGLVVFDTGFQQFFHWVDNLWVVGLGAFSDIAGGDLQGNYPNPTIRPDAVNSSTILDGTIANADLSDGSVTRNKIDAEGNSNSVLSTDGAGLPQWESRANFLGNSLNDGDILIGDAANAAQSRTVSGDISLTRDGIATISNDAITTDKIQDDAITASDIGVDAVGSSELASGSVGSDEIQDGAVNNQDISDNSITSNKIQDDAITAADIATDAVTSDEISSGAVGTDEIQDNSIGTADLADNSVTSSKILDGTIASADIASDAITSSEIATGAVASDEIVDGSIQGIDIANNAIDSDKIADGSVATDDIESGGNNKVLITTAAGTVFWENISLFETSTLAEGNIFVGDVTNTASPLNARGAGRILIGDGTTVQSLNMSGDISLALTGDAQINSGVVGSNEVTDNSLSSNDIAPDAIEASELADDAVDNGALQDDAISTIKIQNDAVTTQKIASDAVTSGELADGTITEVDLADDAVSTAKMDGEGNADAVLTTTAGGDPQWETRSNFGTSSLPSANIFIGDATGVSQPQTVTGDVSLDNSGNVQILSDVIGTAEIVDNAITVDDIGPNAVESSELADNAVDNGAIQTNAVNTIKIADDAVTAAKIDGGGNSDAILTTDGGGNPQWESKSGLDVDPVNEIQDLDLAGNTLSLTSDPTTVDLSGYLDNTDNQDISNVLAQGNDAGGASITNLANPSGAQDAATKNYVDALDAADLDGDPTNEIQDLTLTTNTLALTGDPTTVDLSGYLDNTDSQDLSDVLSQGSDAGGSTITNLANPSGAQDAATKNYVDALDAADLDGDPNNEIQDLSLAGNTLSLTSDVTPVDLSGYLDNTDAQDLSLAGNTLSLTGDATNVDLSGYLDNTDAQDMSLAGNTLSLTGDGTPVDLSGYLDNTDAQDLSLAGNTLSLTGDATNVDLSGYLDNTDSQDLDDVLTQGNNAGGSAITNLANPTNAQDAATKDYVDNMTISTANINDNAVTNAKILDGTISNADINGSAAIDGSKVNPDFGNQNIQTTGTLNTGGATVSSLTVSDLAGATDTYTGDGAVNSFTISAAGAFSSSDERLKENIEEIPRALDKLVLVEGKSYTFISDDKKQTHYGVIAQDLQKLFPHLVHENEQGYLSVNYLELIPVLVEALKQQQTTINNLVVALERGQELNNQLKAGLDKQQQLVRAQQFILTQLQADKAAMQNDIKEIRQSLGLEAKK